MESPVGPSAARTGCALFAPLPLGCLLLSGDDAIRFLHGQCTQDVKVKAVNEGGYAFVLDARGRNLGDLRFVRRPEGIYGFAPRQRLTGLAAWLDRFVIAADVRITDVSDAWSSLLVAGPRARGILARVVAGPLPGLEDNAAASESDGLEVLIVGDRCTGEEGFDVWIKGDARDAAVLARRLELAGASPIDAEALDVLRIEAGRPLFGIDLDENVLPEESGQGERAVSYTKGCYSGQEVVAKQKYLGKPRKALGGVLLERVVAAPAAIVAESGDEIGRLTSCAHSPGLGRAIGLAMLRFPPPPPGTPVAARGPSEQVRGECAALPFIRASS